MNKIGMVIARCGERVVGGSESLSWHWALLLKDTYEVDILTTTAIDLATWKNAFPPGEEEREGVHIRRFNVDQGRTAYWHELHNLLLKRFADLNLSGKEPHFAGKHIPWTLALQEEFIYKQGPYSKGLTDFLSEHGQDYKAVFFFTYLYPTTYWGVRQVPKYRCLFVPTLHFEAPALLSAYQAMAERTRCLLWNTEAEQKFGEALWGDVPGRIVGMGINTVEFPPAQLGYPYLLYCGRIDPYKGGRQLLEYFLRYKQENPSPLRLLLTGKDELGLPKHPDIEFRGFVSEEEKFGLMAGALLFVMPSPHESLSIVTLEAMAQRTPTLVNAKSEVLAVHINKSNGGFLFTDYDTFSIAIHELTRQPSLRTEMGDHAREYVATHYSHERTKNTLIEIIEANDDLKGLQRNWDEFGKTDAFDNILVTPSRKEKWTEEEFFQHGRDEIAHVIDYMDSLRIRKPYRRALDFGCGAGRITQALCEYFEECYGVDIAPSMIELGNRYNRYGNKCRYFLNETDDLRLFEDNFFDFIYSNIVLQHMEPDHSRNYIKEFLRTLTPGGLAIFQIPSERLPARGGEAQEIIDLNLELPDSAFRAEIALIDPPAAMKALDTATLRVRAKNVSGVTWPAAGGADGKYRLKVGNHWIDQGRRVIIHDDGRATIPTDIHSMEGMDLSLSITAPPKPGLYFLEIDLVQEGVAWFKEKGSRAARVRVKIEKGEGDLPEKFSPRMEMYGSRKEEILRFIQENGGKLIDVHEYNVCGEEWLSFRYCVTK